MKLVLPALVLTAFIYGTVSIEQEEIKKLAFASNDFGFKLFRKFGSGENVFFSPVSIFIALSMLYQGARGATAEEMRQVLSYDITSLNRENLNQNIKELRSSIIPASDQYVLDISNAMLSQAQYPVADEYKEVLKTFYDAILKEVDFANDGASALDEVNNWVSNKTRGKIPKLLESLDPRAVLVLLNAVYFKSAWEVEFSPKNTRNAKFYNKGIDPVTVPMMHGKEKVLYWENESFKALKLPYKGNNVSMILLLPNENSLNSLELELNVTVLETIVSNMIRVFVTTDIPRFKLEYSKELAPVLQNLGMNKVFTDGADLSGISEKGRLKASKVTHKAYVEVNEQGSEAAGATGIEIIPLSSIPPRRYFFNVDRPFLFFIRDERTGIILFFGRVNEL